MNVLVTGAGGPAGVAVINALGSGGHNVVAADADPSAVGLRLAHASLILPRADDPTMIDTLVAAVVAHRVEAIVSTVAEEMAALSDGSDALDRAGARTWLPTAETIETCIDKLRFAEAMTAAGLPVPVTAGPKAANQVPGPWIVKPRFGRGSRDVWSVDDEAHLEVACRVVPDPIVQTRLVGREFTVDALVDHDGTLAGAVPRWRVETKAGISTKGETFVDPEVTKVTEHALAAAGLTGVANVQGFVDDHGTVWLMEINPRFSGGLPLSLAAGADLVGEYLRGVIGEPIRPDRLVHRAGVVMLRHHAEVFEG